MKTFSNESDNYVLCMGRMDLNTPMGTHQKERNIEIKFSLKKFGGEDVCLIFLNDISQRQIISTLNETLNFKNKLLASISHELRTPLNGNINFVERALEQDSIPEETKQKLLTPALRCANYLLTFINDILDYSQIQANVFKLHTVKKSIVETVSKAF